MKFCWSMLQVKSLDGSVRTLSGPNQSNPQLSLFYIQGPDGMMIQRAEPIKP